MSREDLSVPVVRKFVRSAGGNAAVAALLGVPFATVVLWCREGIVDDDAHAIALTDAGCFPPVRRGPPPRCTVLLPGELDALVATLDGFEATAKWLGVSVRTLRRYRAGKTNPTEEQADRTRVALTR